MDPIVTVTGGQVRGRTTNGVTAFLAIPYASPPVGPLRFQAPHRVANWDGVRDGVELGPTSPQIPYPAPIAALLGTFITPGDDYLHLNVWTPDGGGSDLPVLVWIHGGAFSRGSNTIPTYDGTAFARDGVVLVSINYRLGFPGFGVVDGGATNRGLRDQLFALEWVQNNVAAFGGDPAQVTVFGESAGAMSVAALLTSPLSTGLFHRAIMQSGNVSTAAELADARNASVYLADQLGVEPTVDGLATISSAALLDAQTALAVEFANDPNPDRWGASAVRAGLGAMTCVPTIDGDVVPQLPVDAIRAGAGHDIAVLAGTNSDEFRFFTVPAGLGAAVTIEALPFALARYGIAPAVVETYAAQRPEASPGDLLAAVLSDHAFRSDTTRMAELRAHAPASTHLYDFAWASGIPDLGACHALEIGFVFDNLVNSQSITGPTPPQQLADRMHSAWVAFAQHGNPGWPRYEESNPAVQMFDDPESRVVLDPRAAELAALRAGHCA
ncbi:carboxylesterase/lipase family protein [Antrihabitans cavernicola]|uniref:Carboxylic ester hydrolase n=1 Tax=Antrihabitans cavernicola TaxID=2495913 RepID=A0A5A7SK24_9NOCA|nr:carboxylesterase family protein [Spelaeibacter cavernicola]KAA0025013.1 carboxylesterase/lipase family protein [Spelaeibacter cavernicola]